MIRENYHSFAPERLSWERCSPSPHEPWIRRTGSRPSPLPFRLAALARRRSGRGEVGRGGPMSKGVETASSPQPSPRVEERGTNPRVQGRKGETSGSGGALGKALPH